MTSVAESTRNPFIAKLERGAELTDTDRAVLANITHVTRHVGTRQDLIREGERPDDVHLVLDGFACRYKMLADGSRQNVAYLVPGDLCDLHVAILDRMDHAIATLSPCTIVAIPRGTILELTEHHPRIARALWWCTLVDEGTLREWLVNLGQREASQRMAHLFCELLLRLQAVGLADANSYGLPLTQDEIGDTLGITPVHANRTLQDLRKAELLAFRSKRVTIPDPARLMAYCDFDPSYLHLTNRLNSAESEHRL